MPESLALVDALRVDGVAAVVSGAGPTVLAFCDQGEVESVVARAPHGWTARATGLDRDGVRVG
jgi:homoserine kinase